MPETAWNSGWQLGVSALHLKKSIFRIHIGRPVLRIANHENGTSVSDTNMKVDVFNLLWKFARKILMVLS